MKKSAKREEFVSTRSRIEKLGVKSGADIVVLGVEDDAVFMKELHDAGASVRTTGNRPANMIFALFRHRDDLRRLPALVPRLHSDAVLWTLRPKGSKDLTEAELNLAVARMTVEALAADGVTAALARTESRGCHHRAEYSGAAPDQARSSVVRLTGEAKRVAKRAPGAPPRATPTPSEA